MNTRAWMTPSLRARRTSRLEKTPRPSGIESLASLVKGSTADEE